MFCMKCGQQLPEGAKFCMRCGTPQGEVSPTGATQTKTINHDGMHTFIPAMCPNCNAHMKVDSTYKIARCDTCGTECLVQDAIKALSVRGNVQIGSATINVTETNTDRLLQRVEIMLADGDFDNAMKKCDTILDSDSENGKVYFFMLLADLKCKNRDELANQPVPFECNQYYIKAIQYGDDSLKTELSNYSNIINKRIEEARENSLITIKRNNPNFESDQISPKVDGDYYIGFSDGKMLSWKVISVSKGAALIISTKKYKMPFHQPGGNITWENCSLRKWLNNDFINTTFTPSERERIRPLEGGLLMLHNLYNAFGGKTTTDKIFILDKEYIEKKSTYDSYYERMKYDSILFQIMNNCWILTPGKTQDHVQCFRLDYGYACYDEYSVDEIHDVCPAMWIKLDAVEQNRIQEERKRIEEQKRIDQTRIEEEQNSAKMKNPKVGDTFYFGGSNGYKLSWQVLRIEDRKALVITSGTIGQMLYHEPGGRITWHDCTLRKWLNWDFLNNFTQAERERILPCELNNDKNPQYKTRGSSPTTDKVFLLSINEAQTLFAEDYDRAINSYWWLRSPGRNSRSAAFVDDKGKICTAGSDNGLAYTKYRNYYNHDKFNIQEHDIYVRPAMWIKLDP